MSEHICECIWTSRDTQEQRECGKPATHKSCNGYFCDECLHEVMQDASPEEHASVEKLL